MFFDLILICKKIVCHENVVVLRTFFIVLVIRYLFAIQIQILPMGIKLSSLVLEKMK